jgi:polyisoprenoid-binding protein YceI
MTTSSIATWTIDPDRSSAEFQVKHLGLFTVHGLVERFHGSLLAGDGVLEALALEAEGAPDVAFVSSAIGGAPGRPEISGALRILAVTREIVLEGELAALAPDAHGRRQLELSAAVDVRHEDFDVEWEDLIPGSAAVIAGHARLVLTVTAFQAG